MDRKITSIASINVLLIIFNVYHHDPVAEARGGGRSLSRGTRLTLDRSLTKASHDVDEALAHEPRPVAETTKVTCARRFNESIDGLTESLIELNDTATAGPQKNTTAYIESWVGEAERNETECLAAGLGDNRSRASTVEFSAVSYALCCSLLYFGFVSVVLIS